jgi:prefoldin subunit 5
LSKNSNLEEEIEKITSEKRKLEERLQQIKSEMKSCSDELTVLKNLLINKDRIKRNLEDNLR